MELLSVEKRTQRMLLRRGTELVIRGARCIIMASSVDRPPYATRGVRRTLIEHTHSITAPTLPDLDLH